MSQMTDFLEAMLLNGLLRTAAFTKPSTVAVALCTGAPGETGTIANEVTNANGYARVDLGAPADADWAAPGAGGLVDNAATITFPTCVTATWGTVSHVAITDSATHGAGNVLLYGTLDVSKVVGVGDVVKFNVGELNVTFA